MSEPNPLRHDGWVGVYKVEYEGNLDMPPIAILPNHEAAQAYADMIFYAIQQYKLMPINWEEIKSA